jgi:hypothetical protein
VDRREGESYGEEKLVAWCGGETTFDLTVFAENDQFWCARRDSPPALLYDVAQVQSFGACALMRPSASALLGRSSKTVSESEDVISLAASGASSAAAAAASSLLGAATALGQGLSSAFAAPVAATASAAASVLPRADRAGRERELSA